MIPAIALLLACQLIGEVVHRLTGLPLPGPVIGMALLFAWLQLRPGEHASLKQVANWLIGHFAVLFIPATMGLVDQGPALRAHGLALVAACVVSTIVTAAVTAITFDRVARRVGTEVEA